MEEIVSLVRRAKEHDPDAFTTLMDTQMQGLYRVARSILHNDEDVADAIQETILNCWEKIETLQKNQYFKTWLTRILMNNCYRIRQQKRYVTCLDEVPEVATMPDRQQYEWEEALSGLEEHYRLVIILYYAQGFRTKEIAKILDIPDNTVRTRLARARKQLKEYYKEC